MPLIVGYVATADATPWGSLNIDVTGWSGSIATEVPTYEIFGSQWKQAAGGTQQITGSITGIAEDDAALMSATHSDWKATVKLTYINIPASPGPQHTIELEFSAILSNLAVSKSPGGNCEVTADFSSDAAITFTAVIPP